MVDPAFRAPVGLAGVPPLLGAVEPAAPSTAPLTLSQAAWAQHEQLQRYLQARREDLPVDVIDACERDLLAAEARCREARAGFQFGRF